MKIDPGMEPVALLALVLIIGGGLIGALWLAHHFAVVYDKFRQSQEQDNG